MSEDSGSMAEDRPIFRPFTRESLEKIESRISEEYAKKKELEKKRAEGEVRYEDDDFEDSGPRPNPNLEQGMPLPIRMAAQFNTDLACIPLEDFDSFYSTQATFVIVSKKKDIFRFSATKSVWLFSPWNPLRQVAIGILTHSLFTVCIICTILTNCFVMILPSSPLTESTEVLFTAIYTFESAIKITARGFMLEKFTYLRDSWNLLDASVILMAYITMGINLGNLAALRTFRVLRALKTVAIVPGLKTIVGAVIESVKNLRDVIILTMFSLSVFALIGLQLYLGILTQICIKTFPFDEMEWTEAAWEEHNRNKTYWWQPDDEALNYPICGNHSAGLCPENYTCLQGWGPNPDYGYTSYDSFGWALLSAFRLMTQDFWESLYQQTLRAAGPWHMLFFILVIFLGSFYLVNLILAIVAMSYDELQKKAEEEDLAATQEAEAMKNEAVEAARLYDELRDRNTDDAGESRKSSYYEDYSSEDDKIKDDISSHLNRKLRRTSLSVPDSPQWNKGGRKRSIRRIVDVEERLPYVDDSTAFSENPRTEIVVTDCTNSDTLMGSQISLDDHSSSNNLELNVITKSPRSLRNLSPSSAEGVNRSKPSDSRRGSFREDQYRSHENSGVDMSDVMMLNDIIEQARRQSKMSERLDEQGGNYRLKQKMIDGCLRCIDVFCVWNCGYPWSLIKKIIAFLVFDPFAELLITAAIAINTAFMALDHYGLQENVQLAQTLKTGNVVFSTIFAIEATMKLIALSPKYYFQVGWNIFDFVIVTLSLLEMLFEDAGLPGISALRSFRLLRVFKLAKSWPTLNLLISIMGKTMGALGNLVFVLLIIIFIFAVCGMQLFSKNYYDKMHLFPRGELPRWNFTDFGHSFMIIFRVLCGEWIESMWDCMLVGDKSCVPFFLASVIIGNLVVLNLFLALLLSSFGASNLSSPQADAETNKLAEAFHRINRFVRWIRSTIWAGICGLCKILKCCSKKPQQNQISNDAMDNTSLASSKNRSQRGQISRNGKSNNVSLDGESLKLKLNVASLPKKKGKFNQKSRMIINAQKFTRKEKSVNESGGNNNSKTSDDVNAAREETLSMKSFKMNNALNEKKETREEKSEEDKPKPVVSLTKKRFVSKEDPILSSLDDEKLDNDKELEVEEEQESDQESGDDDNDDGDQMIVPDQQSVVAEEEEYPTECCPVSFYEKFPIFNVDGTEFGAGWSNLRLKTFRLIENKYFETAIIIMILLSSLALALEDVHLPKNPVLIDILYYMDRIFTVIFLLEMLVKWLALGFRTYFTNAWCWLDFVIVMVSIINFVAALLGFGSVPAFKTMRTLRALRPLRAMSRMQGMRVVVNALVQAIPSIFNVLLVCLIFWLIFAIMGVQLFNGKFHKCIDPIDQSRPDYRIISGKLECLANNMTWLNSRMNFDHVGKAYLSLFQVATFKGWLGIMSDATDSRQEDELQPFRENNFPMMIYFVVFIIFGAFFTLNLFIGVIIDNFNEQKKKAGGSLEMFMTEDQKKYYAAMKKMGSKKPIKAIPRPKWRPQAIVFEIITNKKFDITVMLFIALNMFIMTMDHYNQSETYERTLSYLNAFFIAIFSSESLLKLFALRYHYFTEPWNLFDFSVVICSVLGLLLSDLIEKYFVSPTLVFIYVIVGTVTVFIVLLWLYLIHFFIPPPIFFFGSPFFLLHSLIPSKNGHQLRVVRVAKVGRVLRLVKGAKGIRTLLFALAMSLPALFNICLLLFLIMFIFSIFGMSFFKDVKVNPGVAGGLDDVYNFRTFGQSMILLFQMSTSAGWDGVLNGITDEDDCSDGDSELGLSGDCGNSAVGIAFLLSYLVISFLIIINMYIAVILENYSQATEEVQEGLTDDDYDMYYEIWAQFDPDGCQYIRYDQLSGFLDVLEPPLQMHKPNRYKIIAMDIPICKGDMMYCVDILDALTRDFFTRKGNTIESETVELSESQMHHDRLGYEPISSTLWRQREIYCAKMIQNAWQKYTKKSNIGGDGIDSGDKNDRKGSKTFEFQTTTIMVNEVEMPATDESEKMNDDMNIPTVMIVSPSSSRTSRISDLTT